MGKESLAGLEEKQSLIGRWTTFSILIIVAIFLLPTKGVYVTSAANIYLRNALQAYKGMQMDLPCRPLFLWILNLSFHLGGVSIKSAYFACRFFFVLNILMAYLLASHLYGYKVGQLAAILIIFSFALNYAGSFINVDPFISFFLLLFVYLMSVAFSKRKWHLFMLAGLVLSMACAVKESAFPMIGLPLLLVCFIKVYRTRQCILMILVFYLAFFIGVLPTLYYSYSHGGLGLIMGHGASWAVEKFTGQPSFIRLAYEQLFLKLFVNIYKYLALYICANFVLWPLFFAGLVFIIIRSIFFKINEDILILTTIALFSPNVIIQGFIGERIGQGMPIFCLAYIIVAYLITFVIERAYRTNLLCFLTRYVPKNVFGLIAFAVLICFQFDDSRRILFPRANRHVVTALSFYRGDFKTEGRITSDTENACKWIIENVSKGSKIYLAGGVPGFDFCTSFAYQSKKLQSTPKRFNITGTFPYRIPREYSEPFCVFPCLKLRRHVERYRYINLLFKEDLEEMLKESRGHYLVILGNVNYLTFYLDLLEVPLKYKYFQAAVYHIPDDFSCLDKELGFMASDLFGRNISWLQHNYPEDLQRLKKFLSTFDIEEQKLDSNSYEKYQHKWIVNHLAPNSKIAVFSHEVPFPFEDIYEVTKIGKRFPSDELKKNYDYLLVSNLETTTRSYGLPEYVRGMEPLKVFLNIDYFGNGWTIYDLKNN